MIKAYDWMCEVRWLKGKKENTVTTQPVYHLSPFANLIADHRKKLANHEARLGEAGEIYADLTEGL